MRASRYKIRFIGGDLLGRSFALKDSGLVVGSSADADVRTSDEGVAARHISLMPQSDSGVLLCNSGADLLVKNAPLASGSSALLELGDDVRLGKALAFVLEKYAESPAVGEIPSAEAMGEATLAPGAEAAKPLDLGNTRYASAAELEDLRDANRAIAIQRRFALFAGVLISLAILALAYYLSESAIENPATWPGEVSGAYDDGERKVDLGDGGRFLIYYPNSPAMLENSTDSGFEILTAVGKNLDIPFFLSFSSSKLEGGFRKTARESFREWFEKTLKGGDIKFTSAERTDFFNKGDNGYPYIRIDYTRKAEALTWRGVACYMRFLDREIIFRREIPSTQYWRAASLLNDYDCMSVANSTVRRHWEIPEKPLEGDATKMLQSINRELQKNMEISSWQDIDLLLKSVFVKAYERGERPLIEAAGALLEKFRAGQKVWYSRKCLEYSDFRKNGNKAEMSRILNECLEKFEPLDDYRYTRIMKNDWSIE